MYLDRTFARKTFAQRIGSAKVKSKSEVAHCCQRSQQVVSSVGYDASFSSERASLRNDQAVIYTARYQEKFRFFGERDEGRGWKVDSKL